MGGHCDEPQIAGSSWKGVVWTWGRGQGVLVEMKAATRDILERASEGLATNRIAF